MYRSLPLRVSLALFTCGSGFGQLAPPEALSEAFQLRSRTVVGDWDGDGRDDVAYWTEDGVFTRTSGPTGLAGPEILAWPTAERIADLRSFDVDGDGDADLTLAKENEGGWLENTGGTFGAFQVLVTDVEPSFGEPDAVGFRFLVTDANGDGMADVVALTAGLAGPGPITVRLGTATGVFA
ncbi:MAG: VCBS repeat-containing protein, partial [Planctomycetota bacterium]